MIRPLVGLVLCLASSPVIAEIQHRFLAVDESRAQLHYVDQVNPGNDWTLKFDAKHRDLQLVDKNRVLLSTPDGFREYDLGDRHIAREVRGYRGAMSARRLPDGRTWLICSAGGVTLHEFGPDNRPLRQAKFSVPQTRVMRRTSGDTFLFGCKNELHEGDWQGRSLRSISLPTGAWAYQAVRRPDGALLVAGGYDPRLFVVGTGGEVRPLLGGKDTEVGRRLGFHFFGAFQELANGNIVVANWTGHGHNDSQKGHQIIEFDAKGATVWAWHDPVRAGSINGVLVMEGEAGSRE